MEAMTKEQAIKFLNGKKTMLANKMQSRFVQEKLFKIGFKWYSDGTQEVRHTESPFLYFDDGEISQIKEEGGEIFDSLPNTFISPQGIVNIKTREEEEEPKFKFGQLVLVKDVGGMWSPAHFAFIVKEGGGYPYAIFGGERFEQCVPYEGNEHLLGTDKDQ